MSEIVEIENNGSTTQLSNRVEDSLDLYFKIHERVNAKSEEIQKTYKNNIIFGFNDLKELHLKTIQSIKSLKPGETPIGVRIAISHNEGESEKFNSFEAFERHNSTSPNPTSVVNMIYTFALFDNESQNFENYRITNQIRSRVSELKQLEQEAPPFIPKSFLAGIVTTTAKIIVEYSDYVKARHFTAMFDEWIKSCDESKASKTIKQLKKHSHYISPIGRYLICALLALFTINALDMGILNSESAVKFLVIYGSIFVILGGLASIFLRKLEESIDSNLPLSYLNLNKGDAKLKNEFEERNKKNLTTAIIGITGTVLVGVTTRLSYDFIKWLIN